MRPRRRRLHNGHSRDNRHPDLENTVILGDVTADGTIPPLGEDVDLTALIEHAEAMHVHCVILPAADLAQAGRPDGVEIIGVENLNDLTR